MGCAVSVILTIALTGIGLVLGALVFLAILAFLDIDDRPDR